MKARRQLAAAATVLGLAVAMAATLTPAGPATAGGNGESATSVGSATVNMADLDGRTDAGARLQPPDLVTGPAYDVPDGLPPAADPGGPLDPPFGDPGAADPPSVGASFQAIGDNNTFIPPDTHGAVGTSHVVTALNPQVRVQDRVGTVLSTTTLLSFWTGFGLTDVFDPRMTYDPYGGRFITTAVAQRASAASSVMVGVSASGSATGSWCLYRFDADAGDTTWADYPALGFNKDWIAVSVNMFTNAGSSFSTGKIWTIPKATTYGCPGGITATVFTTGSSGFTIVPAVSYDSAVATLHLAQRWNGNSGGSGFLRLYTITGAIGSEVFTAGGFPSTTTPWATSPPTLDFAPQLGTASKIAVNDDRMHGVVFRSGSIWATHSVFYPATGATRSSVQWWQITPATSAVVQRGLVDDPSGVIFYGFPSIAVNSANHVVVGYSRYSAGQYASANYSFRYASDPANTLQADTVFKAGEAPYFKTYGGPRNRWGDYSNTVVDPLNDSDMWTIQEYAWTPGGGFDRWSTWWAKIVPGTPPGSPGMSVSPTSIDFGTRQTGSPSPISTVTVTSTGTATLTISSATLGGTNPGDYTKTSDGCTGASLAPGATCTVGLRFTPAAAGTRSATLTISGNAGTAVVSLTGRGDAAAPVSAITPPLGGVLLPTQTLAGTTTDDVAGVSTVTVTWTHTMLGTVAPVAVAATLSCNASRTSCTWTAAPPLVPGTYAANARGTDLVGRTESPGPTIAVIVV